MLATDVLIRIKLRKNTKEVHTHSKWKTEQQRKRGLAQLLGGRAHNNPVHPPHKNRQERTGFRTSATLLPLDVLTSLARRGLLTESPAALKGCARSRRAPTAWILAQPHSTQWGSHSRRGSHSKRVVCPKKPGCSFSACSAFSALVTATTLPLTLMCSSASAKALKSARLVPRIWSRRTCVLGCFWV